MSDVCAVLLGDATISFNGMTVEASETPWVLPRCWAALQADRPVREVMNGSNYMGQDVIRAAHFRRPDLASEVEFHVHWALNGTDVGSGVKVVDLHFMIAHQPTTEGLLRES